MNTKWWQGQTASIIWTALRVWLGVQWIEAGWHKLVDGFDATGFLHGAVGKATGEFPAVQGWYAAFLENFALPNVGLFNFLVPVGEVLVGLGLIFGLATVPALLAGILMNWSFLMAGTVSTNPMLLMAAVLLLFVGYGAYRYGLDRYAIPFIKEQWNNRNKKHNTPAHAH